MSQTIHRAATHVTPAIEYSFDDAGLSDLKQSGAHAWICQVLESPSSAIIEILRERWRSLQSDGPRAMRELILRYQPKSIVVRDGESYLLVESVRGSTVATGRRDVFLIPPPHDPDYVRLQLKHVGFENCRTMEEFLTYFGGIYEDIYLCSQQFAPPDRLWLAERLVPEMTIPAVWEASTVLFFSDVGDTVCVRADGVVACLLFAEAEVVELHMVLDEFLVHFARYRESELQWETGAFLEYLSDQQG